jgi:hypothetical protein
MFRQLGGIAQTTLLVLFGLVVLAGVCLAWFGQAIWLIAYLALLLLALISYGLHEVLRRRV